MRAFRYEAVDALGKLKRGWVDAETARQVRDRPQFRNVTLIAQTGWGRDEDRNQARDAGFDHHLVKPIDHQRLAEILAATPPPHRS